MTTPASSTIDGRFEIIRELGRGGMATVFEVHDRTQDRRCALKRLSRGADDDHWTRARALFEREYHGLKQLSHPRVISAYEYGVDDGRPYYTMELLPGSDLQSLSPMPWRQACAVLRDVCSVVSLLHARNVVHRDLSPRNIRCLPDGSAKLMDFGAASPMGPSRRLIGTPPVCPPEVLNMQHVDGRTDLYSLGCTLYYALTGKHAYPASDFGRLAERWSVPPVPPSERAEMPVALERLVLAMIHLSPDARPASAAQVFEQLTVIADLPPALDVPVSRSYLHAPALVGRERALGQAHACLVDAVAGAGGALLVVGRPGSGRSRFLEAIALDAQLGGAAILEAGTSDGSAGAGGGARALGRALLRQVPSAAALASEAQRPLLAHLLPELQQSPQPELTPEPDLPLSPECVANRAQLHRAFHGWFAAVSRQRPLVLAVDDIERLDEFSAALIALLCHRVDGCHMLVVASTTPTAAQTSFGPLHLLGEASTRIDLGALLPEETEQLARALFGDVEGTGRFARWLQRMGDGLPGATVELARHLIDRGLLAFESGHWVIPSQFDGVGLPASMDDAARRALSELDAQALQLAQAVALVPEHPLGARDLMALAGHQSQSLLVRSLDALLALGILRGAGRHVRAGGGAWQQVVLADCPEATRRQLHLRAAAMYAQAEDDFRTAQHLFAAGDEERALDLLVDHAQRSQARTDADPRTFDAFIEALPEGAAATYARAIALCESLGRPVSDRYALCLRSALMDGPFGDDHAVRVVLSLLRSAMHLSLLQDIPDGPDPLQRLQGFFDAAQRAHEALPAQARLFAPREGIRPLVRGCAVATAAATTRDDLGLWGEIPDLTPFEPLSPSIGVVRMLVEATGLRMRGREQAASKTYEALLARAEQPDRAGLDETYHRHIVLGAKFRLGVIEAKRGSDRALLHAAAIARDPQHEVNATLIRMLLHLWHGQTERAADLRTDIERMRVENAAPHWFEGTHLMAELTAHAMMDDLEQVRRCAGGIELMAKHLPAWVPVRHLVHGELHRIRGALHDAERELSKAASLVRPGAHALYCEINGGFLRCLVALGHSEEAAAFGALRLRAALDAGLADASHFIRLPLALALASQGQHDAAWDQLRAVEDALRQLGAGRVMLGLVQECGVRLGIAGRDTSATQARLRSCAAHFERAESPTLAGRFKRLAADVDAAGLGAPMAPAQAQATDLLPAQLQTPLERAQYALGRLIEASGAEAGALFAETDGALRPIAESGVADQDRDAVRREATAMLLRELAATETATVTGGDTTGHGPPTPSATAQPVDVDLALHPVLLAHDVREGFRITGVAVLIARRTADLHRPTELAARLSRAWAQNGDVTALGAGAA